MRFANRAILLVIILTALTTGAAQADDSSATDRLAFAGSDNFTRLRFVPPTLNDEPVEPGFDEPSDSRDDASGTAIVRVAYAAPVALPSVADAQAYWASIPCWNCCQDCDSSECRERCAPCPNLCPCGYGYVEGLIYWRDNGAGNQPLVFDQNTGDTLLATGDLGFDAAGGVRAVVGKRLRSGHTLEVSYFGLFDSTASERVTGNNDLQLPGDLGLLVNNFFGADIVDVSYRSSVHSVEANLLCCDEWCGQRRDGVRRCREWAPFIGFRYLNFNEDFEISSTDFQEGTTDYDVRTHNNLFGAQLGGRYRVWRGGWSWEAIGKAGVFGNAAEQSAPAIVDFLDVVRRPAQSETGGCVAFVGEINLTGIYNFDEVWGFRAGYNLLWIDGVALAPDQLDFSNNPDSGTFLDTSGSVFMHGVSVGLEARW